MISNTQLNKLYKYAFAISNQQELAYDLVHDAVLKIQGKFILRKIPYLKVCIRNNFYDRVKKQSREETLKDTNRKIDDYDLENLLITKEQLNDILQKLNPEQRELIYLLYIESYTYKEVANLLNIKIGTVMSRLHRCKNKIQQIGGDQ